MWGQVLLRSRIKRARSRFAPASAFLVGSLFFLPHRAAMSSAGICQEFARRQAAIKAAEQKEQDLHRAMRAIHDPGRRGQAMPIPAEVQSRLPATASPAALNSALYQARSALEAELKQVEARIRNHQALLTRFNAAQSGISKLAAERSNLLAANQRLDQEIKKRRAAVPAAKPNSGGQNQVHVAQATRLDLLVKTRLAIPGRQGLNVSTPDGVLRAIEIIENYPEDRTQELNLTSPEVQSLRQRIQAATAVIDRLQTEMAGLEGDPVRWNEKADELGRQQKAREDLQERLHEVRLALRTQVLEELNQLLVHRNALSQGSSGGQPSELANLEKEWQKNDSRIQALHQQISAQEKQAVANTNYSHSALGQAIETLKTLIGYDQGHASTVRERLAAVQRYGGFQQANSQWSTAHQNLIRLRQELDTFRQQGKRDELAALARARTLIEQPMADYRTAMDRYGRQEGQIRNFLVEWNQISATRTALQNRIDELKRRGQWTESARAGTLQQWEPLRLRRNQMLGEMRANNLNLTALDQKHGNLLERRRQEQQKVLAVLRQARALVAPYDCELFPNSQSTLRSLDGSINDLNRSLGTVTSPSSPGNTAAAAGFMVIPDLNLPATDKALQAKVPVAKPSTSAPAAGIPAAVLAKTVRQEQLVNVEGWYLNPGDAVTLIETSVTLCHLRDGGTYMHRVEYDLKRSEMAKRGYKFAWSISKEKYDPPDGIPLEVQRNMERKEERLGEEGWRAPGAAADTVVPTKIILYYLKDGNVYFDRDEYDRKRAEMSNAGYQFRWARAKEKP